jgi:outer membrane lipoprotein carrier protein
MRSKIGQIFLLIFLVGYLSNLSLATSNKNDYYIDLADSNLKKMITYKANFIQTSDGNNTGEGVLYIDTNSKKVMWTYLKPTLIDILIYKRKISYFDKAINEVSYTSVDSGLFTLFTDDNLGFNKDVKILDVKILSNTYAIKIKNIIDKDQREDIINLIFDIKDNLLIAIEYFSQDGNKVLLKFSNIELNQPIDKKYFKINKAFLGNK